MRSLENAPDSVSVLSNQSALHIRIARMKARDPEHVTDSDILDEQDQVSMSVEDHIAEAMRLCNICIARAPDYAEAYNHKGVALTSLGDFHMQQGLSDDVEQQYMDAIREYANARERSQRPILAWNNLGNTLSSLGLLKRQQGDLGEAREFYNRAIQAYRQALTLAPGYLDAVGNLATVFVYIAALEANIERDAHAITCYELADEVLAQAQQTAPNSISFHIHRAMVLSNMARGKILLERNQDACADLLKAQKQINSVITIAPMLIQAQEIATKVQAQLDEFCD